MIATARRMGRFSGGIDSEAIGREREGLSVSAAQGQVLYDLVRAALAPFVTHVRMTRVRSALE